MRYRSGFLVFLLGLTLISYGCGSGGGDATAGYDSGTSIEDAGSNTARVSLTIDYPDSGEAAAAALSPSTTHILINIKQWVTDDLNKLSVVNTDKELAVVSGGTTVNLDLLPTRTRFCASQWEGDPNNIITSTMLETACTSGELVEGNNTISLTMIRGEWTLSAPFGDLQAFALARTANQVEMNGIDVYDGYPAGHSLRNLPFQAYNDWGSAYGAIFKEFGSYQVLPNPYGFYQNSFSSTEPNLPSLFVGSMETTLLSAGPPPTYKDVWFMIGGFSNATDPATGILNEKRDITYFNEYKSGHLVPNEGCYSSGSSSYYCHEPVLFSLDISTRVEELVGGVLVDVTAALLDDCQVKISGGSVIDACAVTDADIVKVPYGPAGPPTSYRYKVTGTAATQGANICYQEDGSPGKDSLGNTICTSDEYSYWSESVYICNDPGMTWNPTYGRCEQPLESACTDQGGTYDLLYRTCTIGGISYSSSSTCSSLSSYTTYYTSYPSYRCWNNNRYSTYNYGYNCWSLGTYNTTTRRCEATLEESCLGYVPDPADSYDAATETCTSVDTTYYDTLNFTPVTLTGVGTLPSSVGFGP